MISAICYPSGPPFVLVAGAGDGIVRAFLELGASVGGIGRTASTLREACSAARDGD